MRFLRDLLATGSTPCPPPPGMPGMPTFDIPTSPIIGGKKLFSDSGPGYMPLDWEPPKPTHELPVGWFVDDSGFFTLKLPAVNPTKAHFKEADCTAFPYPLSIYRLALDRLCHERFKMNAYWVGLHFHHFMGEHVPGFWDTLNYQEVHDNKIFRLIFDRQCEIIFYGTHSGVSTPEDGATLIVVDNDGSRHVLLYDSPSGDRDICYPEHRELKYPSFELPSRKTAKAIIWTYAMVAAIPSDVTTQLEQHTAPQLEHKPETH